MAFAMSGAAAAVTNLSSVAIRIGRWFAKALSGAFSTALFNAEPFLHLF